MRPRGDQNSSKIQRIQPKLVEETLQFGHASLVSKPKGKARTSTSNSLYQWRNFGNTARTRSSQRWERARWNQPQSRWRPGSPVHGSPAKPSVLEGAEDSMSVVTIHGMGWVTRGCWDWIDLVVIGTGLTLLGWVSCGGDGAISRSLGTRMAGGGGWWGRGRGPRPRGVGSRRTAADERTGTPEGGGGSACGLRRRGPRPPWP